MGVVKHKNKTKNDVVKKKEIANGKPKKDNEKVKKKKSVSCLQCIKSGDDGGLEGKYRVAAPELMQDTFMSDSEDEGGEVECPIQQQQQYRYMNSEAGTLHRAKPLEDSVTDGHLWPSNNDKKVATIDRQPLDIGFLVSFVVDARGGAMKAKRRGGVRIIVPPAACAAPTRVTCRAATRRAPAAAPPPLMEGEALASRLLELQPQGAKFLAPVVIEVPIFTSSCPEREIVILRSDTGETWQDHYLHSNDNPMIQEALQKERQEHGNSGETLGENGERVTRIITCDFPHYLAVVSRIRQEVHIIGPEGGTVSSAHIPQVQAQFPAAALTKRIRVGLQAHGAAAALQRRALGRRGAASPVLTVEPRRRKFHRTITLTVPLPLHSGGAAEKPPTSSLRLLCSIMGGQARAVWEDVTGSTPLTLTEDCASFTTTVSARFWLMNCQNVSDATKLATELYREMLVVPFEARVVVLGKRLDALEGRLLVLYITDRYAYDTLLHQEHYTEVAHSTSVRFLDGKEVYLEFSGNLIPVTKSGSQPMLTFEAFKDNRVEFTVRVKHHEESPSGRIYFMNEPKVPKGEQSQTPACVLDVQLPDSIVPRAGKSQLDYLNLDQSGFDALKDELSFHWGGDHNNSLGPGSLPYQNDKQINGHDKIITNGDVKYPTKDTDDSVAKPQVNGDTVHVDSNKTKATFDSDEDKTPMNTLEKGKKKAEGGSFFGGLAGKVKNVFSHSEDKDEETHESSPKPQPKPRESKEKSPPKPAPRVINEDLLDKVEDMFKDLKQKPAHKHDDDLQSEVYTTKLVINENDRPINEIQEEVYNQYANMQPVETPQYNKVKDPFQYPKCCDSKYKHSHEETSNLQDIIEHTNFATHEKLQEGSGSVKNSLNDGLAKLEKEKENVKQKADETKDNVVEKCEKVKDDVNSKKQQFETIVQDKVHGAQEKLNDLKESAQGVQDNINVKASDISSKVATEFNNINSTTKGNVDHLIHTASGVTVDLKDKANEINFAALERAEQLRLKGDDKLSEAGKIIENKSNDLKNKADDFGNHIKTKTRDGIDVVADSIHSVKDNLSNTAQEVKSGINEATVKIEEELNQSVDNAKEKAADLKTKTDNAKDDIKSEVKKKSKEGKNFFTGLVHNIFGEKDKIEDEVKGKIAEGKESAKELAREASIKKKQIEKDVLKNKNEIVESAEQLARNVHDKKEEVTKAISDKKSETEMTVRDKTEDLKKTAQNKTEEIKVATQNEVNEITKQVQDKKDEVTKAISDKKSETEKAIRDKTDDLKKTIQDKTEEVKVATQSKVDEVTKEIQDKKEEVTSAIQNKKDSVEKSIHDKANDALTLLQDTNNTFHSEKENLQTIAQNKVDEAKQNLQNKSHEVIRAVENKTEEIDQTINDKRDEITKSLHDKKDEWENAIHEDANNALNAVKNTKDEIKSAVQNKNVEINEALSNKKEEAKTELDRIRYEAEQTTEEIKRSAEDALNAAVEKGKDGFDSVQKAAIDNVNSVQRSSKQAFDHVQDSTLGTLDKVESSAKDNVKDAKDTWEDLQSSTRDTYADFKDDVHSLGSSAQDTLHSFQSSAGDTFDSLDDSAREVFGGVQTTTQNAETRSKELFGDLKDSFEGFQVSADNKLEDVKGAAKNTLEETEQRLGESIRGTEQAVVDTVTTEADKFTSSLNDLGNSVFGSSGKGFMKDSSSKLLESEKAQSSPHKKGSGIPKLKRKK